MKPSDVQFTPHQIRLQKSIENRIAKAYNRGWIQTIDDLMAATYGTYNLDELRKDSATATSTTGARNILYGAGLMAQIIVAANTLGTLPKKPWQRSGYRAITAAASTASAGISQGGAIPATIQETFAEIGITPKALSASFDMTSIQRKLEGKDDVVTWAERQAYTQKEFKNRINRGLNTNVTTLASTNIESVDRMLSSYAEVTNCGDVDAGDSDPYGAAAGGAWNDRDAGAGWTDAYVDHNSNTDEYIDLAALDTVLQNIEPYWDESNGRQNKVIISGYDTMLRIGQLLQAQLRYTPERVTQTVNGMKTAPGQEAGFEVSSYNGIPVIRDSNTIQDTLSRVNFIDMEHLWVAFLQPVTYLESDDYQALDKFATEGVYYAEAELICDLFAAQGKIRDKK